jgi:hypothetical protein
MYHSGNRFNNRHRTSSFNQFEAIKQSDIIYRPPSYEPYRPLQPKTVLAFSDDESYLGWSSENNMMSKYSSRAHFPELLHNANIGIQKQQPTVG